MLRDIDLYWRELKETTKLALPLSAAYAGNQLMGLVDMAVVGRLDTVSMAGTGLAGTLYFIVFILGMGLILGIDPLASQAVGANNLSGARRHLSEAIVLCILLTIPTALLMLSTLLLVPFVGIDEPTRTASFYYLLGRVPSILPYFIYIAMRGYLQAISITRPIWLSTLIANILNLPITLFLTLGDRSLVAIGLPPVGFVGWGVFGAAIATSIVSLAQMFFLIWSIYQLAPPARLEKATRSGILQMMRIGYPISLHLLAEGGMFALVTVLSGRFGPDILGGHHLAIMIASFTFSVCLGVSSATSVRVGHAIGRSDTPAARCAGFVGIATGLGFMSISALCLWLGAWPIAKLFAKPTEVVAAAVPLLYIAAIFQLFDGTQIIASGALRGIGETKMPMRINIVGYWLLALPTALVLAFYCKLEAVGLWWGLTMGLMITSIFLTTGFHRITKNKIQPIAAL